MPVLSPDLLAELQARLNGGGIGAPIQPASAEAPVHGMPMAPMAGGDPAMGGGEPVPASPAPGEPAPLTPPPGPQPMPEPMQAEPAFTLPPTAPAAPVSTELNGPTLGQKSIAPGGLAREASADANSSTDEVNRANQLKQEGLAEEADVEEQQNKAMQPFLQRKVDLVRQADLARRGTEDWIERQQVQAIADTDEAIAKRKELYAKDPHDWWGNSSISQKAGALIGMVGAGMQQESASRFVDGLIQQAVTAQDRKEKQLGEIEGLMGQREKQREKLGTSALARDAIAKASALEIFANEVAAAENLYKSPMIKANLKKLQADSLAKAAELKMDANKTKMSALIAAGAQQMNYLTTQMQTASAMASKSAAADNKNIHIAGYHGGHGIQPGAGAPGIVKDYNSHVNALNSLEKLSKVFEGGLSMKNELQRKVLAALASGDVRAIIGTGANLSAEEVATLQALIPDWSQYFKGKVAGHDITKQIQEIRFGLADRANQMVTSTDEDAMPDAESPVGRTFSERSKVEETIHMQRAVIDEVMQDPNMKEVAKIAKLHMLAANGNEMAAQIVGKGKGKHVRGLPDRYLQNE